VESGPSTSSPYARANRSSRQHAAHPYPYRSIFLHSETIKVHRQPSVSRKSSGEPSDQPEKLDCRNSVKSNILTNEALDAARYSFAGPEGYKGYIVSFVCARCNDNHWINISMCIIPAVAAMLGTPVYTRKVRVYPDAAQNSYGQSRSNLQTYGRRSTARRLQAPWHRSHSSPFNPHIISSTSRYVTRDRRIRVETPAHEVILVDGKETVIRDDD